MKYVLKLMIIDEKENADITADVLRGRYEILTAYSDKGIKDRLSSEKPDMLIISADSEEINYTKTLADAVRGTPELAAMPVAILSSLPSHSVLTSAKSLNAEVILRPYEPLELINRMHQVGEQLKPVKERVDFVTGLHKREYTEERIKELFPKKSGTLFIIDVAKFRFACQPISESVATAAAGVVSEDAGMLNAILGVQKDRKLIGYIPDINERAICLSWAKQIIKKIQDRLGDEKVYISVGFACNDEKSAEYKDLYQLCDRALNLAREKGSNTASYY